MKVTVKGSALVIESKIKAEDIKFIQTVDPDALKLKNEDGKTVFQVSFGVDGGINEYGITFNGESFGEKKVANLTLSIPNNVTDVKEYAANLLGNVSKYLSTLEEQLAKRIASAKEARKALVDSISIED